MSSAQVIRVSSARVGSIGAGSPWPIRLVIWLILLPLAILILALALVLAAGLLLIAAARSLVAGLARRIGRVFGPGDGRRNVRIIDPSQRP